MGLDSTLEGVRSAEAGPRMALGRRLGAALIALAVAAGLAGLLGDRVATREASEGDLSLRLEYAESARPGQDVPWEVELSTTGSFPYEVTLAVTADYFDIYETQGWYPEPSAETRDGQWLYLTFDAPEGSTLKVGYDAYIQPNSIRGRAGEVAVVVDGRRTAVVPFRTVLFP